VRLTPYAAQGTYTVSLRGELSQGASTVLTVLNELELLDHSDDALFNVLDALPAIDPLHLCRMIKQGWLLGVPGFQEYVWADTSLFLKTSHGALCVDLITNNITGVVYTADNAVAAFPTPFTAENFMDMLSGHVGAERNLYGRKIFVALALLVAQTASDLNSIHSNDELVKAVKSLID